MMRIAQATAFVLAVSVSAAVAQDVKTKLEPSPSKRSIYDPKADAREAVTKACAQAKADNKHILVMFGGDWCGWCHKLHTLFIADPEIRKTLYQEYVLVMVDTKAPNAEGLLDECKGDLKSVGYPFLAVLDAGGKVVTRQPTDSLEVGDHHDPAKVKAFLDQWTTPKVVAETVLADALAKARSQDKLVFVHLGAPWCGWCHRLDDFLAREDVASILGKDFIDVKIDIDRMTGGKELEARLRANPNEGIPWIAFMDAQGKTLVNGDGPKGNIGYPYAPEEIDHFIGMVTKVARKIEPAQIEALKQKLKDQAEKIEAEGKARQAPKTGE